MSLPQRPYSMPIEYHGITYRSALEADLAATFDTLRIYFQYEPEPLVMPSGAVYNPDFYLPNMRVYAEAKGAHNDRVWKPRELAAVLEVDQFMPNEHLVVILRAAGPMGGLVWETASSRPNPHLIYCEGCRHYGFSDYWETGEEYCRRCWSTQFEGRYYPDLPHIDCDWDDQVNVMPMQHAPRPWAQVA